MDQLLAEHSRRMPPTIVLVGMPGSTLRPVFQQAGFLFGSACKREATANQAYDTVVVALVSSI